MSRYTELLFELGLPVETITETIRIFALHLLVGEWHFPSHVSVAIILVRAHNALYYFGIRLIGDSSII